MEDIKNEKMNMQDRSIVKPAVSVDEALKSFRWFSEIKEKVLSAEDKKPIAGKPYINKSGWRKIKTIFNLSEEILDSQRQKEGNSVLYIYRVRVQAPNGVFCEAEGMASTDEDFAWADKEHTKKKPESAIMGMAQTRAYNRAISDLVGGGELSVEEAEEAEETKEEKKPAGLKGVCSVCQHEINQKVEIYSLETYGKPLCFVCQRAENKGT